MTDKDTTITIRISARVKHQLTMQATENGDTLSQLIRQVLARAANGEIPTASPYNLSVSCKNGVGANR